MADRQRLKLTLRNRVANREWVNQPRVITADPEDHDILRMELESMARDLDHRGNGAAWWMPQYEIRVQGIEQEWRDETIPGGH